MATTEQYLDGGSASYTFSIEKIKDQDIKVAVDGTDLTYTATNPPAQTTEYTVNGSNVIFKQASVSGSATGGVRIYRETELENSDSATFVVGNAIRAADLNANHKLVRFASQEQNQKITTNDIRNSAVTSAKILDGTIVNADVSSTAEIEVSKLQDGSARQLLQTAANGTDVEWSSNIDIPGTLDVTGNTDIDANLNVDGTLAVNGSSATFNATTTVNGSLVNNGNLQVDNINLDGNEIQASSGGLTIDSASGTTTVDDNLVVTGTANFSNATTTFNGSQVVTETASQTLTNKTLTTPVINDMSGTAVVTSGTSTSDNKIYSAKRSDELYYRKGTADDIEESGVPWSGNDSTIATTAAIDARIVDIVDDVGGFVPLADEGKIPQYHPEKENKDTADRVGTILSIGTLTTTYTPSTGTVTIQASDLLNHSVNATITDCGSTVLPSGFGVLVETKPQTDSQYAAGPSFKFHRLVPKATEVTTVAGKATEVTTVHTNITNINAVATDISNVNAVANDATDIGAVAAKATEIGRLGTADAVADMAILGTADVVSDLNTLGTADVVADMNMLATSDVVADMNTLATTSNVSNMDTVAGAITNVNNVGGSITSVNSAASNLSSINKFGDQYQVSSNNPSTDGGGNALAAGDLYFNTSANELKVYNGSTWQGGVTASGSFASTTGNTFTGNNIFTAHNTYNDSVQARFGTGNDFKILHDGTDSYLDHGLGSGLLRINAAAGAEIRLTKSGPETLARFIPDGAVELNYDNSKKFETTSTGVTVNGAAVVGGNIEINQDAYFKLGVGQDLQFHHGGSSSYITNSTGFLFVQSNDLALRSQGQENFLVAAANGAVELYYDNVKKFETSSGGAKVYGDLRINDNEYIYLGDGTDLQITVGSNNDGVINQVNGDLKFQRAGSGKFTIKSTGTHFSDDAFWSESQKAIFGTGSDLQIYHDGSSSNIKNVTDGEYLNIYTNDFWVGKADGSDSYIVANHDDGVDLYYDGSKKFETTTNGAEITGRLELNGGYLSLHDNYSVLMGDQGDGQLYHNGAHQYLLNTTGNIYLMPKTSENGIVIKPDANVELYHDNALRLKTEAWGVRTLAAGQDTMLVVEGEASRSAELRIYADNGNQNADYNRIRKEASTGKFHIQNLASGSWEDNIVCINEGAAELYYDNSKKLHTVAGGVVTTGYVSIEGGSNGQLYVEDNGKVNLGSSQDLKIFHDGTDSYLQNSTGYLYVDSGTSAIRLISDSSWNNGKMAAFYRNGGVELYYDNSKKLETTSAGISVTGSITSSSHILLGDGDAVKFGDSTDLEIMHNGSSMAHMHNATGHFVIDTTGNFYVRNTSGSETMIQANADGAVDLYYDNALRFQTHGNGVSLRGGTTKEHWSEGHFIPWANNTYDLGTSTYRWRNIYTNDLHLSNEGSSNDVDSTWGDWTIQEGESDLFLKNNRSGKKYKFNLTEVS